MTSKAQAKKYVKKNSKKKGISKKKSYNPMFESPRLVAKPEKKWFDVNSTLTPPIGSAFVTTPSHLNPIQAGTGPNGRVGAKVLLKSLLLTMNVLWNGGQSTNAPSQVRVVVVYDKQANASIAGRNDVFQDGTQMVSPQNLGNPERFVTLIDEMTDIGDNGQFTVTYKAYRKCNLETTWSVGSSSTIPTTGALLMFVAANSDTNDAVSGHFPACEFWSRIRYTDV